MGILDGLVKDALGGILGGSSAPGSSAGQGGTGQSPLIAIVLQLIQSQGGLPAILAKLKNAGLGKQADSWVSTGDNTPVSPEQLTQALGPETMAQLSTQAGVDQNTVATQLSQLLPSLVDKLTPDGNVPDNHQDLLSQGLSSLSGYLGGGR